MKISWLHTGQGERLQMTLSYEVDNQTSPGKQWQNVNFSDTEFEGDTKEARSRVAAKALKYGYVVPDRLLYK